MDGFISAYWFQSVIEGGKARNSGGTRSSNYKGTLPTDLLSHPWLSFYISSQKP